MVFRRVLSTYRVIIDRLWAVSPYIFANCCSVGRSVVPSFRLVLGKPDADVSLKLVYNPNSNTRGNNYKLLNQSFHYDARKYCFSARIVNIWNSLPNDVVDVNNVNQFKARLDKFWMHQDVKFDFTADLTGIGERSVRVICDV